MAFVITTIQAPTQGVRSIAEHALAMGHRVIVIGDRKSPAKWVCQGVDYVPFDEQANLPFASAQAVPTDSYTRKILGYLLAFSCGADWIRETDDDNAPYASFFEPAPQKMLARRPVGSPPWVNIYTYFTDRHIWPRGFPLSLIAQTASPQGFEPSLSPVPSPYVLQALADGDPDVDAIYRLTASDLSPVSFSPNAPIAIPSGTWTPFNSQATTWPRELLPLMYLPSTCSFRMTDIWRSFVAQKLMNALGIQLIVTAPSVFQERNPHDLMKDFSDEIEGYLGYQGFVDTLNAVDIEGSAASVLRDLRALYEVLIAAGHLSEEEFGVLDPWIEDMRTLGFGE